jgi:transmembrane sensor
MLGWGIVAGGAVGVTRESPLWHYNVSDYSTGTGEWKQVQLADGTQLMLNTATAIDIDFNAETRRVLLHAGEIYIRTASDPQRPFLVETRDGTARALGTRYSVRKLDGGTQVRVYEHAVELAPHHTTQKLRLDAGQQAVLTPDTIQIPDHLDTSEPGWTQRRLVAERMRLDDFLAELSRYRNGILRCDPRIADLRLTGIFPLDDIDRALATLEEGLPVKLDWTTRYWLTVRPRSETQA